MDAASFGAVGQIDVVDRLVKEILKGPGLAENLSGLEPAKMVPLPRCFGEERVSQPIARSGIEF